MLGLKGTISGGINKIQSGKIDKKGNRQWVLYNVRRPARYGRRQSVADKWYSNMEEPMRAKLVWLEGINGNLRSQLVDLYTNMRKLKQNKIRINNDYSQTRTVCSTRLSRGAVATGNVGNVVFTPLKKGGGRSQNPRTDPICLVADSSCCREAWPFRRLIDAAVRSWAIQARHPSEIEEYEMNNFFSYSIRLRCYSMLLTNLSLFYRTAFIFFMDVTNWHFWF